MNQTVTLTGIVLSATPMGEYDRRVVILTKERGKISAFAKGARKPNSPLVGVTSPFSFGQFLVYEGRNSYNLQQAVISNYFTELREDMEAAYYGFYFLEFAEYYTKEANDETQMLKLLYQTLRALAKKTIAKKLIRYIFELKAVTVGGEGPQVFSCVTCGAKEGAALFSAVRGGIVCEECAADVRDGLPIHTSTLYAMQFVVSSPIEKLYTFTVTEQVLIQFGKIMERYLDVYMDKRFKSLDVLEMCLI